MNNLPGVTKRLVETADQTHIVTKQVLDPHFFEAIKAAKEMGPKKGVMQYRGSVPITVAQQWARECGAAIGTREFKEYAKTKLASGEFNRLIGR